MQARLDTLLAGLAAPLPGGDIVITALIADSREAKPGALFFALPGATLDGAAFAADAAARGASAVVAARDAALPDLAVPVVRTEHPRRALALAAARFFGAQPPIGVAVTGTNGKTSVVSFVRQIWERMAFAAASIGTVGVVGPAGYARATHTTPDPVKLHTLLAELADHGVTHFAMEASSHGLAQHRLDGVRLTAAGFTNITRDHLDYHPSFDDYLAAKLRLFTDVLPEGAAAVVDADGAGAETFAAAARARGVRVLTTGRNGGFLRLAEQRRDGLGQHLTVRVNGGEHRLFLPLAGAFQASNALVAAGLALAAGSETELTLRALESLKGAAGRLELVARTPSGAPVFVDYAHTPDALETVLKTLRPYTEGRLAVVFGCGGDRDRGKRPQMGAIAARLADVAYVTDDNPRGEDPALIRRAILAACPGGVEVGDRAEAIRRAVRALAAGDVLVVAGKGHETGQIVGATVLPFSDQDVARDAAQGAGHGAHHV
jgi:UDP-N-acetylmuramoyl-L-alanyl-D-glutamate--2,6-diaminopimelate ligase